MIESRDHLHFTRDAECLPVMDLERIRCVNLEVDSPVDRDAYNMDARKRGEAGCNRARGGRVDSYPLQKIAGAMQHADVAGAPDPGRGADARDEYWLIGR